MREEGDATYALLANYDTLDMNVAGINVRGKFLNELLWQMANLGTNDIVDPDSIAIISMYLLGRRTETEKLSWTHWLVGSLRNEITSLGLTMPL